MQDQSDEVYTNKLLAYAATLSNDRRLENPDVTVRKASRVCGSTIEVDLKIEAGRIVDFAQEVNACALGQTSAAIVAKHIVGSTEDEMRLVHTQMSNMLKAGGAPPTGKWAELGVLESVKDFAPRHKSIMLVFDAVVDGFDQMAHKSKEDA